MPSIHQIATTALPQQLTVTLLKGGDDWPWPAVIALIGVILTIVAGFVTYFLGKRAKEM